MLQQFVQILERSKEDELIFFLKSLSDQDKRKLVPDLKKITKDYLDYKEVKTGINTTQYKQKANEKQQTILLITSFVCCTRQEFEKVSFPSWITDPKYLRKVIDWYCPTWFSDFVNKLGEGEFLPYNLKYEWVMELTERGLLSPSKQLLAKLLPQIIYEYKDRICKYKPENVLTRTVTLAEHAWYLFEIESDVHSSARWLNFEKGVDKDKVGWIDVLKTYASEGKIDRTRLLQEALLASNRNFNKVLSGWFSELFTELEPTTAELITLQTELFSVLSSTNSKPVNTALQNIKKIITQKTFDTNAFLDNVPLLLTSVTKNIVTGTLGILEKLAKANKSLQLPICKAVVQVFIHANDELQARAAKLIIEYEGQLDDEFSEALAPYRDSLMSSARKLLDKFLHDSNIDVSEVQSNGLYETPSLQPIELPESTDDLVFLASQAFDNNQSWHIDVLPAAIIKWLPHLKGNQIDKLEPALQRALKLTKGDFRSGQGSLDHMLAIFFIDVCIYFCRKFPVEASNLTALFGKFDQGEGRDLKRWLNIAEDGSYTAEWDNHYHDPFYIPHKKLLLTTLQKINEQELLPLLSTPTYEPGWILPETLVKRVIIYQKENRAPFNIDYQVAVSRCLLTETAKAIELAETELKGENKNLLLFLFGKHKEPMAPFNNNAVWMCCSLALKEKKTYPAFQQFAYYKKSFEFYTGQYQWQSVEEEYTEKIYDYQNRQDVTRKAKRKTLKVHTNKTIPKESAGLKKFFGALLKKPAEEQAIIYDDFVIKAQWLSLGNDLKRLLLLTPNNPEPFLAAVINRCLQRPTFWSEDDKRAVIAALQTLHEIWNTPGNMAYLLLGTSMIASDKTVVNIAGEIWIEAVRAGNMDNAQLGKIIGLHESIEFAPLKRFTDLVSQNLFRISPLHNNSLMILTESLLTELPDVPIKNLKKLLEIFAELKSLNKNTVTNPALLAKLNTWKQNAGLQKTIAALQD